MSNLVEKFIASNRCPAIVIIAYHFDLQWSVNRLTDMIEYAKGLYISLLNKMAVAVTVTVIVRDPFQNEVDVWPLASAHLPPLTPSRVYITSHTYHI